MHVPEVAVAEAAVEAEVVLPVIHRLHKDRPAPILLWLVSFKPVYFAWLPEQAVSSFRINLYKEKEKIPKLIE